MRPVVVVGGANMDIHALAVGAFRMQESNIGRIRFSPGGVGRNIAENLARLGVLTTLVTSLGGDANGSAIQAASNSINLRILSYEAPQTSCYVCLLDDHGELVAAVNHMEAIEMLTPQALAQYRAVLESARYMVVDANLCEAGIVYLAQNYPGVPKLLDAVSAAKCVRAKSVLGCFSIVRPNRNEAEALSGVAIQNERDLRRAAEIILESGVAAVLITLGAEGVYIASGSLRSMVSGKPAVVRNATGAGDAFTAAVLYAHLQGMDWPSAVEVASAAARFTLGYEYANHPDIGTYVSEYMKENF